MDNEKEIDDIVSMIDQFMEGNGGHLNVSIDDTDRKDFKKKIVTTNSLDCAAGNLACKVPTLHDGLDGDE